MVAKVPIRTVYTGANATGLSEYQTGEFIDYNVGGTGLIALGTANQILATNAGATAMEWQAPTTGDITGVTAGAGLTGGGTSGTVTLDVVGGTGITSNANDIAIDATVSTLTGSQTLTNKGIDLGTNTLTGSVTEFNAALQSESFATLTGSETLTNKTLHNSVVTGTFSSSAALAAVQMDITAQGELRLQDTTGGEYVAIRAPATIATNWRVTLPATVNASTGQALRTSDGAGTLEWYTPGDIGDITAVIAGAGLTGGGSTGSVTLDVIGGTGITANADDIAITAAQTGITEIFNSTLKIGTADAAAKINFGVANQIIFAIGGTSQVVLKDGQLHPATTSDVDLGKSDKIFKDAYVDTITTTTGAVLNGTLSGTAFLDEDNMASNSAIAAASQQSIKSYVDATASGLDLKDSSHAATAAALAAVTYSNGSSGVGATLTADNNGALTVDGQTMVAGERVLVKDQSAGAQNGIYSVTATGSAGAVFVLTRTTDFDSPTEVTSGAFTFIETGTTNSDSGWVMTTDGTVTIGTTALAFSQFSGAGQITAGTGLTKTGNTLALDTGINTTYLADGSVTSTEFQYINTLSSNAQTQLDTKATKGFSIAMGVALG